MSENKIKNLEQFAVVSGISRPTLSKYFRDPESVRISTRKQIEDTLNAHNYVPNIQSVSTNNHLNQTIAIIVPYLTDPFFGELVRIIKQKVSAAGYVPALYSSDGERQLENDILITLKSLNPAGVLLAPLGLASDREHIAQFCTDVPTVMFDSYIDGVASAFVGSNNSQSISMMVDYLIRSGAVPCFFEMPPINPNADNRRMAYLQAMKEFGHTPMIVQVQGSGWDFEDISFREGLRIIEERGLPSNTVLCSNDRLAIGLLSAAYKKGICVGRDAESTLRIAGHDDHPYSRFTCPSLTTVAQDYESIARQSVDTLFEMLGHEGVRGAASRQYNTLLDGKLVMRASA
ncbi:MAG: LacI family DNA-binding transcriptional regulator [Granulosicoccus sp.]